MRHRLAFVFVTFSVLAAGQAMAATPVTQTDLGTLGGGFSRVSAINAGGTVVGTSSLTGGGAARAFAWTPAGGMVNLGSLGGSLSDAYGVNDLGQVVGESRLAGHSDSADLHAFSWTAAGGMVDLGVPAGDSTSDALGVNANGQVIGNSLTTGCGTCAYHAWVWTPAGGQVVIGSLGGRVSQPEAENDGGQVVGVAELPSGDFHSFSWTSAGGTVDMGTLGGNYTFVRGINAGGMAVGDSTTSDGDASTFVWSAATGMVDVGCLASDACNSSGYAINDDGAVVGSSVADVPTGFEIHAYIWTASGGMVDLGTLGGDSSFATDVNASGQVSGTSNTTPGGDPHAFLWTRTDGMIDLGPMSDNANGLSLNDAGTVIGNTNGTDGQTRATTWALTVGEHPAITSAASTSAGMRAPFDFHVTTSGSPSPSLSESGALPTGVTFSDNRDGTGELAGAAAAGTAGVYPITLSASNGFGGPASQSFTLTVTAATSAPAITSVSADTETFGVAFSFPITTSGYPVPTLKKTGNLPAGVTYTDNGDGTGTVSGTPAKAAIGAYAITLTAKSSAGTLTQTFTLTITKAPSIKKIPTTTGRTGASLLLSVTAAGFTVPSLSADGLPSGLNLVDHGDGTAAISGTPAADSGGSYAVTVTATNGLGSATQSFTLKINDAPEITSTSSTAATIGSAFSFQVTATGFPVPKLTKAGTLPKGIAFNAASGSFSGTPKANTAGSYPITITAKNSTGTTSQSFTLVVH